jgi:hypothetical protein
MNLGKSKIMTRSKSQIFKIDRQVLVTVDCYTFLGSVIIKDGMFTKETKTRIVMEEQLCQNWEKI